MVVARIRGFRDADRLTRGGGPAWQAYPDLDRLVFLDPDLSWDEVDAAGARAFIAEMGHPVGLVRGLDIDLAKIRADAMKSMTAEDWAARGEEPLKAAYVTLGIMRPDESLEDLPDVLSI
jgi:hypothetical protein